MKFAQISVIVGVLLLQVLLVKSQDATQPNSDASPAQMANEGSLPQTTMPSEAATKPAESATPPLNHDTSGTNVKKDDAPTVAPSPAETTTKPPGGGSNSLYHSIALMVAVSSFLYLI